MNQSFIYESSSPFTLASEVVPANYYASELAMLDALNASGHAAETIGFRKGGESDYQRVKLAMAINGTVGQTIGETLYAVMPSMLGGTTGVRLERLAKLVWVSGGVQIPTAQGGVAGYCDASSVGVTSDGVIEAATGTPITGINRSPATVEIPDVGEVMAILRVVYRGASSPATGAMAMRRKWK